MTVSTIPEEKTPVMIMPALKRQFQFFQVFPISIVRFIDKGTQCRMFQKYPCEKELQLMSGHIFKAPDLEEAKRLLEMNVEKYKTTAPHQKKLSSWINQEKKLTR